MVTSYTHKVPIVQSPGRTLFMLTLCAFSSSSRRITATEVMRLSPNLAETQISHRKVSVELPQSIDLYLDNMNIRSIRKHQNTYHLPRSQHILGRLQSSATLCGDRGTVDRFQEHPSKSRSGRSYFRHVDIDSTSYISTTPKKETQRAQLTAPFARH
jgi:hypothetical protein